MRAALLVLSLLFVGFAGCGSVSHAPPEPTGGNGDPVFCPHICGLGTLCQYPGGRCTEACNPCLCKSAGGTVVTSCRGHEPQACGNTTCGPGTFCCNASCGICAPIGGVCTQQFCNPGQQPQACGNTTCGEGTFCCNASCGICAPIGGFCTQQFCNSSE